MHEMTQSDEYVKCLHVAAALHFYRYVDVVYAIKKHVILSLSSVEAKVFFSQLFFNERFQRLSRREDIEQNLPEFIY